MITLSSGSRDPEDMWRWHADNTTAQAWADSRSTLQALAGYAEEYDLTLAVEPEHSNVVATADQALTMREQVGSEALGFVYDAANLLDPEPSMRPGRSRRSAATSTSSVRTSPSGTRRNSRRSGSGRPGAGWLPWPLIVGDCMRPALTGPWSLTACPSPGCRWPLPP